jgi:hypothetical protein
MSAMLIASHPKPVRDAIEQHRRAMDANPLTYGHLEKFVLLGCEVRF